MNQLIERIESARAESERLFEDAFWAINPAYADIRGFRELLDAKAWLDAALTLVPEGWDITLRFVRLEPKQPSMAMLTDQAWVYDQDDGLLIQGDAATPALALCAASLRAHEVRNKAQTREGAA